MATKINRFTVEGRGAFPYDMLRYDNCWPSDTESAMALIEPWHDSDRREWLKVIRRVNLSTCNPGPSGRWASFMWKVIP